MDLPQIIHPELRVLLVGSPAGVRSELRHCLSQLSLTRVENAFTATSALQKLRQEHFDILLVEEDLPDVPAIDLLQVIRYGPAYACLPFVIIASEKEKQHFLNAVEWGASGYILRPFDFQSFEDCLRKAIKGSANMLVKWSDSYALGVAAMDAQHRRLFSITNELHAALVAGQAWHVVSETMQELHHYTRTHFRSEERLLEKRGYPQLPEHRALHDALVIQVQQMAELLESKPAGFLIEAVHFLRRWITDHILAADKLYAPFVTGARLEDED